MRPEHIPELFSSLQSVLKRRKITYGELARAIDTSEAAVKNMFLRKSCQLERLLEICEFLGIEFIELVRSVGHSEESFEFSEEQEQLLVDYPLCFELFRQIYYMEKSLEQFQEEQKLSKTEFERLLRALEEHEVIERHPHGRLKFLVRGKMQWRNRGPWMQKHYVRLSQLMAKATLDAPGEVFQSFGFATLTPRHIRSMQQDLGEVVQKYRRIAASDYMVRDRLELHPISWQIMAVPGEVSSGVYD